MDKKPLMSSGGRLLAVGSVSAVNRIILAIALLVTAHAGVWAFQLTPLTIELDSQGAGTVTSLTIENTNPEPIAVQIQAYTREVLPDGTERNEPSEGLFRVYPMQMIIQPEQTQVVRVQYVGPGDLAVEQAYRLEARQLPINIGNRDQEQGTGVRIVLRYWATLYVGPAGAAPNLAARVRNYDGDTRSGELVIENRGTGHANLVGRAVVLRAAGRTQRISLSDYPDDYSASLPAGFARVVPLDGVLDFEPQQFEVVND